MPRFIIKVTPEADLYVEWSTVVDNWTWSGTRAELEAYGQREGWKADIEERIARTDETGTSALWAMEPDVQPGSWEDEQMLVTNDSVLDGDFWLDRSDLAAYVAGDHTVLQPIPNDDEEDS